MAGTSKPAKQTAPIKQLRTEHGNLTPAEYEKLGRMMQQLVETGYVSKRRLFLAAFVKGIFSGFGTAIGATILVALFLWILSLFDTVPVIGDLFRAMERSINEATTN